MAVACIAVLDDKLAHVCSSAGIRTLSDKLALVCK